MKNIPRSRPTNQSHRPRKRTIQQPPAFSRLLNGAEY
jgi:hypothetical protein